MRTSETTGTWTPERIETLKQLWTEGQASAAIAKALGLTSRNAVVGKAHRLGLPAHVHARGRGPAGRKARLKVAAKSPFTRKAVARAGGAEAWVAEKLAEVAKPRLMPLPKPRPELIARVTFAELEETHCRMPVGEPGEAGFGFCGQEKVSGLPYCAGCAEIAFKPAAVKPAPAQPMLWKFKAFA